MTNFEDAPTGLHQIKEGNCFDSIENVQEFPFGSVDDVGYSTMRNMM
jgi:hypothetical protein